MKIDVEFIDGCFDELSAMTEEQRLEVLDPVCEALGQAFKPFGNKSMRVVPNRIMAILAIKAAEEYERISLEQS